MPTQETDQPTVYATLSGDDSGILDMNGTKETLTGADHNDVRRIIVAKVANRARMLGRAIVLVTDDNLGRGELLIPADGDLSKIHVVTAPALPSRGGPTSSMVEDTTNSGWTQPVILPAAAPRISIGSPATGVLPEQADVPPPVSERRAARASFLDQEAPLQPAAKGWRGALTRAGVKINPSDREMAERDDIHAVSRHWNGPRTIAIVNGKGGANKTPTTAILAAVFARYGGSGVLAWDNNETRGTLGWRTEQAGHDRTVQDLLPQTEYLLGPGAQSSELSHYVHHQTGDKYDVLRSNPKAVSADQKISRAEFTELHRVATKYFRLVFIDSGNDESAERWQQMIDQTDQLVVATTALGEHAEAGALLLEDLSRRDEHAAKLVNGAVVIVSQSEKNGSLAAAHAIAAGFDGLARKAATIPFDDALHGGKIHYEALSSTAQRAWLAAAAAVAEGL
jgi:MinD-like ATPase involved in chromosome partitioning or flagellar assembly